MPHQAKSIPRVDRARLLELHSMLLQDNGFDDVCAAGASRARLAAASH